MFNRFKRAFQAFSQAPKPASLESDAPDWKTWNGQLRQVNQIKAAFEAGMIRNDLWTLADFKDADATLLPHIRQRIRSRARYEAANNPQVDRVLNVWADDVVAATGPWPKLSTGNSQVDRFIEAAWLRWWSASNQSAKMKLAVKAEAVDGESVGIIFHNHRILEDQRPLTAVSVDVAGFEADRLADPSYSGTNRSDYIDGIHLDPLTREPVAYDLLKAHPGTEYADQVTEIYEHETFSHREFLHAFRKNRMEQHRGNCRFTSALPVAGLFRKYAEAEVDRMATIAAFTVLFKSDVPGEDGGEGGSGNESQWWQEVSLPARKGVSSILPEGFDPVQLKNDGQAANLQVCRDIIAGLVAGCFSMPIGRAIGYSASGGYPGQRADLLPYHKTITSDRLQVWEPLYLRRLFKAFLIELRSTEGWKILMAQLKSTDPEFSEWFLDLLNVEFRWPERDLVVDPSREDEARRKRMAMGLLLRSDEIDSDSLDDHDLRGGRELGLSGTDDEIRRKYRQLCGKSIHQVPSIEEDDEEPAAPPAA